MAGPERTDYCGKLSDPSSIGLCNDVADTCDEIFADAVGTELDERPFVLTLEGGGSTRGSGKASCYQRARSLGSLGRKVIPQARLQAPPQLTPQPQPEIQPRPATQSRPKGPVVPMREDDVRAGFCTERTGFVPAPRARLETHSAGHRLVVDGEEVAGAGNPVPILENRPGVGRRSRMLLLPSRDIHFKKNKAVPVHRAAFDGTIGRMINDISSVISAGPFARICGLDYLKEFSGDLVLYVLGKTDRLGNDAHNKKLSKERARAVAEAIAAKRKDIAGSLWADSQRGLRVVYMGVGESMTKTEDGVSSPKDRRVELYLSTDGPPLSGEWASAAGPGGLAADPSDPLAYYCGGADSDCAAALAQCESALSVMCEEAYPHSDAGERRCKSMIAGAMSQASMSDEEVARWLREGFMSFPIYYDDGGARRVERFDSLRKCMSRAPAIAERFLVPASAAAGLSSQQVVDPAAVKGKDRDSEIYCSAKHGWMKSSELWLSETPKGEMLWHGDQPIGVIGVDMMMAKRQSMRDLGRDFVTSLYRIEYSNIRRSAAKVAYEIVDLLTGGAFMSRCFEGSRAPRVLIEIVGVRGAGYDEVTLRRMAEEFGKHLQAALEGYRASGRLRRKVLVSIKFVADKDIDGLFVSVKPLLDVPEKALGQQGDYEHATGNDAGESIKVLPLR